MNRLYILILMVLLSSCRSHDFHKQITELLSCPEVIPESLKYELENTSHSFNENFAKLTFGMSINEVVNIWGLPGAYINEGDGEIRIEYWVFGGDLTFKDDRLCSINLSLDKITMNDESIDLSWNREELIKFIINRYEFSEEKNCNIEDSDIAITNNNYQLTFYFVENRIVSVTYEPKE